MIKLMSVESRSSLKSRVRKIMNDLNFDADMDDISDDLQDALEVANYLYNIEKREVRLVAMGKVLKCQP